MRKCECGSTEFRAHQIVRMDVIVDGDNQWEENLTQDAAASIYDAETPYGPYTCRNCGRVYNSLDELPDSECDPNKEENMPMIENNRHIIKTVKTFLSNNEGDEGTEKLLICLGAELLDISPDRFMEIMEEDAEKIRKEFIGTLIDVFEDFLEDATGDKETVFIDGERYDALSNAIDSTLREWEVSIGYNEENKESLPF